MIVQPDSDDEEDSGDKDADEALINPKDGIGRFISSKIYIASQPIIYRSTSYSEHVISCTAFIVPINYILRYCSWYANVHCLGEGGLEKRTTANIGGNGKKFGRNCERNL